MSNTYKIRKKNYVEYVSKTRCKQKHKNRMKKTKNSRCQQDERDEDEA